MCFRARNSIYFDINDAASTYDLQVMPMEPVMHWLECIFRFWSACCCTLQKAMRHKALVAEEVRTFWKMRGSNKALQCLSAVSGKKKKVVWWSSVRNNNAEKEQLSSAHIYISGVVSVTPETWCLNLCVCTHPPFPFSIFIQRSFLFNQSE